jgi:hypothetical protein
MAVVDVVVGRRGSLVVKVKVEIEQFSLVDMTRYFYILNHVPTHFIDLITKNT